MTLGKVSHDVRDMSHGLRDLTLRIAAMEGNAKRAFIRFAIWSFVSGFVGGASVVLIYLLRG
jgi:hypothetical protein